MIEDSPKTRKWFSSRKHTFHDPGFAQDFTHPAVVISWDDAGLLCVALAEGGAALPSADRSRMGVFLPGRHNRGGL